MANIYIVTGCAGFIGSHFIDKLFEKEKDCIILGVDKLTYAACLNNMSTFWRNPNFYFLAELNDVIVNEDRRLFVKSDQSHLGLSDGNGSLDYNLIDINELHEDIFYFSLNKIFAIDNLKKYIKYSIHDNHVVIEDNKKVDLFKLNDFENDVYIINFAAESHVDRSINDASPFINTNINGTVNLLDLALRIDVKKFIQISTDEVYGSYASQPHTECDKLLPSSVYSASKASADLLALSYYRTHDLPVSITRSANNYGPRQFPEKVIPVFVQKLFNNQPVPLYGDGTNIRDWLHVKDNCEAIYRVVKSGTVGEIYNVASGHRMKNIDLTHFLVENIKCKMENKWIQYVEDRKGHDKAYWLNWCKIKNELGWSPSIKFRQGMKETIQWYANAFRYDYFSG
jgi:dTDP-glucose 4,6-dehydratase